MPSVVIKDGKDNQKTATVDNIDIIVDMLLAKNCNSSNEKTDNVIKKTFSNYKNNISKGFTNYNQNIYGMGDLISFKKLFSIILSFLLLFAVIASASSLVDPDLIDTPLDIIEIEEGSNVTFNNTNSDTNNTDVFFDVNNSSSANGNSTDQNTSINNFQNETVPPDDKVNGTDNASGFLDIPNELNEPVGEVDILGLNVSDIFYEDFEDNGREPFINFNAPRNSIGISEMKTVDTSYFWDYFNRYSKWDLELYDSEKDKWESYNEYLDIFSIRNDDNISEKTTLNFTLPITAQYRLTFTIDAGVKNYINQTNEHEYILEFSVGDGETYSTFFNWNDIINLPAISWDNGITRIGNRDVFWFRITSDSIVPEGTFLSIDPTFGNTDSTSDSQVDIEDRTAAGYFQTGSNDGLMTSITAYLEESGAGTAEARAGLYNDSNSLLGSAFCDAEASGTNWVTFTFGSPISVKADDWYYIAVCGESRTGSKYLYLRYDNDTGANGVFDDDTGTEDALPDPFAGNQVDADGLACIYATYTEFDGDPPTPDPMTWSTEPYNASSSSISMVATIASDATPPISYYFNETTGNPGGSDSGWQSEDYNYTDNGLSENTQYGYEVKTRDSNGTINEGSYSTPVSYEYTSIDPPTDSEITFTNETNWMNATVVQPPNPTSGSTASNFTWITGGLIISDWQNGIYYHNRSGLSENTQYGCKVQFRNGDGDACGFNPTEKTNYTLCNPPTDGEFTFDGEGRNWINMSVLDVDNNPTTGLTAAYFECVTGGASDSGWVSATSGGRYYYNVTGLTADTTYGFRVKYRNVDGVETTYTSENQTNTASAILPIITTNASNGVETTNATLNGWLQDNGSADTTCYFLINDTNDFGSPIFNLSKGIIADGFEFENDTAGETTLTAGKLYYFKVIANNSAGWSEGNVEIFLTKPENISSFTATLYGTTQINLTWTNEAGGDGAYIEYAKNSAPSPWNVGDGTPVDADGNVTSPFAHAGLDPGTHYYYKAWAYATDGSWTSSGNQTAPRGDSMTADETTTGSPAVVTNDTTGIEETNATLEGWLQSNGTLDTTCYFLWGTQNPPTDYNVTQGIKGNGASFTYDTSGTGALNKATLYYVDTNANNSGGWDETGGVKGFLTKPDPPTNLVGQTNSSSIIYLTWSTGSGYNTTYIERNTSSDWARGDGTMIYNNTGTYYEDTGLSEGVTYYYQAWTFANWTNSTQEWHHFSDNNDSDSNTTNNIPTISNEDPTNGSIGVSVPKQLGITVNDVEGDSMTINWYSNSSGVWLLFHTTVTGIDGNGTYSFTNDNFSNYSQTYYWNVTVSDGKDTNLSDTFHFSTEGIATSVDSISPYLITAPPKTITATGDSSLDEVALYYRWAEDNQSWDSWDILTYDDFEDGFGNYTDGGGDCSLYTGGTYAHQGSNAANIQDDSGAPDSTFYHTSGIDVDTPGYTVIQFEFWFITVGLATGHQLLVEYFNGIGWNTEAIYTCDTDFVNGQFYNEVIQINESGTTFPSNMQIRFQCIAANDNDDIYIDQVTVRVTTQSTGGLGRDWTLWSNANNPDTNYPWSWSFDFPDGSGYYEFYSIGSESGSPTESPPGTADAMCRLNYLPIITSPVPAHQSTNIQLLPPMSITVTEIENETMNITWSSNSSGAWITFAKNNSVHNGTYYQNNSNFSDPGETYYWNISVYDGLHTNTTTFYFTTSYEPVFSNPGPANQSTAQYTNPVCNVTVSDQDGGTVDVSFYENTTGGWILQQTNSSADVTTPANVEWDNYNNATQDFTTYWWKVNVSDGKGNYVEEIYHFTTANTSIQVTPAIWNIGKTTIGEFNISTGPYFNLSNEGDAALSVQINATNATNSSTGALWVVNDIAGLDNYTIGFNLTGGDTWTLFNETFITFTSNLALGSWQLFDLNLTMAVNATVHDPLSMIITFRSVAS